MPSLVLVLDVPDEVGGPTVAVRFQVLTPGLAGALRRGPGDASTGPASPLVLWRLLGANNYELGRSQDRFPSAEEAQASIEVLMSALGSLDRVVERDATGRWRWWLSGDGIGVATSSRSFLGEREAWTNLEQFIAHLPEVGQVPVPRGSTERQPERKDLPA